MIDSNLLDSISICLFWLRFLSIVMPKKVLLSKYFNKTSSKYLVTSLFIKHTGQAPHMCERHPSWVIRPLKYASSNIWSCTRTLPQNMHHQPILLDQAFKYVATPLWWKSISMFIYNATLYEWKTFYFTC